MADLIIGGSARKPWAGKVITAVVVLAVLGGGFFWWKSRQAPPPHMPAPPQKSATTGPAPQAPGDKKPTEVAALPDGAAARDGATAGTGAAAAPKPPEPPKGPSADDILAKAGLKHVNAVVEGPLERILVQQLGKDLGQ